MDSNPSGGFTGNYQKDDLTGNYQKNDFTSNYQTTITWVIISRTTQELKRVCTPSPKPSLQILRGLRPLTLPSPPKTMGGVGDHFPCA